MSRSYDERSVPQERGRRQEKLVKRRSHKRSRRALESNSRVDRLSTRREPLDRETKQTDA